MKVFLLILFTVLSYIDCFSQKLNTKYYFFSSDTLFVNHYLTFKNDSIVQISSIPRHMQGQMMQELKYETDNGKLIVYIDTSSLLEQYGYDCSKEFVIKGNALISDLRKEIYVIRTDFKINPDLIVKIAGREYKVDMGENDFYGLVKKSGKNNKRLSRKLKTVNLDDYEIQVVKGYGAYRKYGYNYVFGIIEFIER